MNQHEKLNYIEFPARNLEETKTFFEKVFSWQFVDYGPEYTAFSDQGLDGGFYKSDLPVAGASSGALVVFYSNDIEKTLSKVEAAGGNIIKPIFSFPGGRRFHFEEPSGNELAVWSEPS